MSFASLSDRLSPILVKEVRQGLRSRTFAVMFGLTLLACMIMAVIAYGAAARAGWRIDGQQVFFAYFACFALVQFVFVPSAAFQSMNKELDEASWQLVTMTGLGARRILRGKVASGFVQVSLFGSALGPFMLSSYYLNGIDLPAMLIVVVLGLAYHVFLTTVAVSIGAGSGSKLAKPAAQVALMVVLGMAAVMGLAAAHSLLQRSWRIALDATFVLSVVAALWAMVALGNLLLEAAAARLALATESYAAGPRRALLFLIVGTIALMAVIWAENGRDWQFGVALQAMLSAVIAVASAFFATEADGLPSRFRQPQARWSLFLPGALRGFRFMLVALMMATAGAMALDRFSTGRGGLLPIAAMPAYALLYVSLTVVIGRGIGARLLLPGKTRAVFPILLAIGIGLPVLVELFRGGRFDRDSPLNLLNPFLGTLQFGAMGAHLKDSLGVDPLVALWAVTLVATIAADRVLAHRDRKATTTT